MKLLLAVAAKLVSNDPEEGPTLVAVFNDLVVNQPQGEAELPSYAVLPRDWAVYSKWRLDPEDIGSGPKEYTQITQAFWPNGNILFKTEISTATTEDSNAIAFTVRNASFPVGQAGYVRILLTIVDRQEMVCGKADINIGVRIVPSVIDPVPASVEQD
jgi:hypothetical protein